MMHVGDHHSVVLIVGQGPSPGVSRSLRNFVVDAPKLAFGDAKSRYPVVLDLYGRGSYDPAEVLAIVRNGVVELINSVKGMSSIGYYLIPFDSLYGLWRKHSRLSGSDVTDLISTKKEKAGKAVAKLGLKVSGMYLVEIAGDIHEFVNAMGGFGGKAAGELAREKATESLYETMEAQAFFRRFIAPIVSRRLRAALSGDLSDVRKFGFVMQAALSHAISRIQADLQKHGKLMVAVDAIDEAIDANKNTINLRAAIGGLISDPDYPWLGAILCGREPVDYWQREVADRADKIDPLGAFKDEDEPLIHVAFRRGGLSKAEIDAILAPLDKPIFAGQLSEACGDVRWKEGGA